MQSVDYLIIGGGIAGTTAAETIRAHDASVAIAIVEREPYPLYSRVLIPHYLKKKIEREQLFLRTTADYEKQRIGFYGSAVMVGCDVERHEVTALLGGKESDEIFSYKKLLIATGGTPKPVPSTLSFGDAIPMLRMQTLSDADAILDALSGASAKEAAVLGEGFIAMEFIETFFINGFRVHALCRGGLFGEKRLGVQGARMLEELYQKHGIRFYKNIKDEEIARRDVWLAEKSKPFPIAVVGAGIGLARSLDMFGALTSNRGIVANEYLQTSNPNVYTAGDVAEWFDNLKGRHTLVGNWTNAFVQGRIAALNMLGHKTPLRTVPTYNIVNFGINVTFVGDIEGEDDVWEEVGTVVHPFLRRVLFQSGKTIGGVLINRFSDKTRLASLIEAGASRNDVEKTFQLLQ